MGTTNNKEETTTKRSLNKPNTGEMSFLEHLEELRWHIIKAAIAVVVFAIIAFIMKNFIFDTLIMSPAKPDFLTNRLFFRLSEYLGTDDLKINQKTIELQALQMSDQFMVHLSVAMIAGLVIASPYVFYQIWSFISPALYENERKYARGAVIYTSLLFMLGVLFGYYIIVPLSIHFFNTYQVSDVVKNNFNLRSYIGIVTSVTLSAGVVFLLPIFSFFLSKVGILTPGFLKKYRKHSYVLMLLLAAIITPPDIFSQIIVFIPLMILYEASIFISWWVVKKRERQTA